MAILSKLSKEYTKIYTLPVTVIDTPMDKVVTRIEPAVLEVSTRLSGFALVANQFSDFQLPIPFNQLEKTTTKQYQYIPEGHPLMISNAISGVLEVTAISPKQITIQIDSLASKEVPVITALTTQFKKGYGPKGAGVLNPSTVRVVGPKAYIDSITAVTTTPKDLTEISQNIELQLTIDSLPLHKEVKVSLYDIGYSQEVVKFTEGAFSIPVKLINANDTDVKIFPKTVDIYFTVPIDVYESITSSDFEVVCDFNKHNEQDDFIALDIKKSPTEVKNIRLATKQIKYIVVH
ncbi:CdaR family protein [Dokdonia ponticola]|uniref:CdaR family protein n=1 Tax=Dokdonia ponticola TaxID=2041041 RepID=A0ABV9HQC7_9FLAO